MVEMAIFTIQRAISLKVGKQELRFMCSVCHLILFNIVSSFIKICQAVLKLWSRHKNLLTDTHTQTEKTKTIYPHGILRMPGV